ncbi:peptidylprolyl isomerase [Novosphingobium mangrovi (ex Huang et al. 2023)]|uniref:Parvulin-like PPIase n=1 Tax=Novosphingobium mangrovi (ex Huang et al. 2023) TaxID=2976432 RepID=A0ABT2I3Z2_9SPHN|nr:peptidylprolyl isomerase [Novosphingobium mangrovi (ex Huang et al. 2023)]MCT2399527.1 SurA N-terminal domain-containing protein [Novosphingobium mangrovi (ex Huang et al. 2023)]
MISIFRSFFTSKIGGFIALAVLLVIAIAFASGDIAGMRGSDGTSPTSSVATVGNDNVDAAELSLGATRALDRVKQQQPTATMKLLVAQGGVEQVLSDLIDRTAFYVFGKDNKIAVSDRLIDSEITQIQAFQGVDGKFDQKAYRQALAQQGISEKSLRDDIAHNLTAQQLSAPAQIGTTMPEYAAKRYASLLNETRSGEVAILPSMLFAPDKDPTEKQLAAFYKDNTDEFIRPERRVIRYAALGEDTIKAPPAPTDAEIAARYEENKAVYAAQDRRKITQLIVPTEAAAKAVVSEVDGGKSLEAAAREKGLTAANLEYFSKEDLSGQFSPAVADAVFAAPMGKLAAPEKSALGWHVIRVDEEQKKPARPLTEVKDEISAQIAKEKRRKAFTDTLANIEDQFAEGSSLTEVAKSIGAEVKKTAPLTADGQVYMKQGESAPDVIKPVLDTAFQMEQEEPQVAEVERGKTFVLYDVTDITASAPAPLKEIEADVKEAWKLDEGSKAAKAAAIAMQKKMDKGESMAKALSGVGKRLPPIEQVSMSRPTLAAALRSGKAVPPPVSLMFHMAQDTVKVQSAPQGRAWFVVQLEKIEPGEVESDALITSARQELGKQLGMSYGSALAKAIRKDVGVTEHQAEISAVRNQLAGTGSAN